MTVSCKCIVYICIKKAVFVQTNSIRAIKAYFKARLSDLFTENEIKQMIKYSVMERLGISSGEYLLSDDQLLSESDLLFFRSIVKRLQAHEPFQYIVGKTEFFGLALKTDSRALIPRPETEELVQWITEMYDAQTPLKILDLCTGSGCIALALKRHFMLADVCAADLSKPALELTKENMVALDLPIETICFDATNENAYDTLTNSTYDVWVSNPPYIPFADEKTMKKNVLDYEPHMALFVENEDALLFYREIGNQAIKKLKLGGRVYFEIHEDLGIQVFDLIHGIGFVNIELRKDLQGKDRMLMAQKP